MATLSAITGVLFTGVLGLPSSDAPLAYTGMLEVTEVCGKSECYNYGGEWVGKYGLALYCGCAPCRSREQEERLDAFLVGGSAGVADRSGRLSITRPRTSLGSSVLSTGGVSGYSPPVVTVLLPREVTTTIGEKANGVNPIPIGGTLSLLLTSLFAIVGVTMRRIYRSA